MEGRSVFGEGFRLGWIVLVCLGAGCWGQDNVIRFNRGEIYEIIKTHNDLRRSVYDAANMRELSWNEGLAIASSEWGSNCEYLSQAGQQWGQNMNFFHGQDIHKSPAHLFRLSFHAWGNQTGHEEYRGSKLCAGNKACSYVQLISADAQQIGCSIVQCSSLALQAPRGAQAQAKLLVCFYSPWVDITNKKVYKRGRRCSACPSGTKCEENICSARETMERYLPRLGKPYVAINVIPASDVKVDTVLDNNVRPDYKQRRRHRNRQNRKSKPRLQDNTIKTHKGAAADPVDSDQPKKPTVVYKSNNRVMPFPGKSERRDIRRIMKAERYLQQHDTDVQSPAIVTVGNGTRINATAVAKSRIKRQTSYEDALYLRRLEYERYLREYERHQRQREAARRQYEAELHRRQSYSHRLQELRRAGDRARYDEERRRRSRLREQRRRLEALALVQSKGELTGEEQFFTVSAHNLLRREAGARQLAWSSNLERWAKYVIRCETEYPGPITCYTNFGKSNQGDEIYNVVYQWGAEGYDMNRPMADGCRTPYDKSLCNHNSILRDKSLTQMACASMNCGLQRQLTCIYSSN